MDLMEQLLCPQVCMDVEDTPLEIEAPTNEPDESPEADLSSLPIELRARVILDNEFEFLPEQVPHELLPSEEAVLKEEDFSQVDYLKNAKLHCTACNKHIGTALVEQLDRYIHPELNTLMCHNCFKFYGSGVFEKDEDGSELYCKWCGQGGTVMCCSDCPLVFCQNCVKKNLGIQKLASIKNSDNWSCLKCDPEQISKFHITCHVLHEYTNKQLRAAVATRNMFLVKDDFSTCCTKRKRRKSADSDDENDEFLPTKMKKTKAKSSTINKDVIKAPAPAILKRALTTLNAEPKSGQKNVFQRLQLQTSYAVPSNNSVLNFHLSPVGQCQPDPNLPSLAQLMPSILQSMVPAAASNNSQPMRIQYQPLRPDSAQPSSIHVVNPKPSMKTAWLSNTVASVKIQAQSLIREADGVKKSMSTVKNYADLANLHNRLQRAMAECTNRLIYTRKEMHNNFLKYLKSNHVSHSSVPNNISVQPGHPKANSVLKIRKNFAAKSTTKAASSVVTAAIDLCDDDDDEVIPSESVKTTLESGNDDPLAISDDDDDEDSMVSQAYLFTPEVALSVGDELVTDPVLDLTDDQLPPPPVEPELPKQNGSIIDNFINENREAKYDTSKMSLKEFKRAISAKIILCRDDLTKLKSSKIEEISTSNDIEIVDESAGASSGFDFVREMQNEIQSVSVRGIDASPPDSSKINSPPIIADIAQSSKNNEDRVPGIDLALEAIKQLTETITETITESKMAEDIDSNDNVKCQEPTGTVSDKQNPTSSTGNCSVEAPEKTTPDNEKCAELETFKSDVNQDDLLEHPSLNVTPPAICLEDMVKIYDACETTIDGDMVPAD